MHRILHSHNPEQIAAAPMPWLGWGEWWWHTAVDALAHQGEAWQWMQQSAQCATSPSCWPGKAMTLWQRLLASSVAMFDQSTRLVQDQQRVVARLSQDGFRAMHESPPGAIQTFALNAARSWGMIALCNQARLAGAWAEFWSLPASPHGGG